MLYMKLLSWENVTDYCYTVESSRERSDSLSGSLRQLTPPSSQENQPVTTTKPSTVPTVIATNDNTQSINHGMLPYIPFQKR